MSSRRPFINYVDISSSESESEPDPSEYCPHCSLKLSYLEDRDSYYCSKCGWNFPNELLNPQNKAAAAADDEDGPIITGGRNDSLLPPAGTAAEDITVVSWSKPRSEQFKDRMHEKEFPGLDDELKNFLRKRNARLISREEYLPSDTDSR